MTEAIAYSEEFTLAPSVPSDVARRSPYLPLCFLPSIMLAGLSWMLDGVSPLTDLAFVALAVICGLLVLNEVIHFSTRVGIGGLVLFGGVLIWFCHDYFSHWFRADFTDPSIPMSAVVIAKAACLHCVFIAMMSVGLLLPYGRPVVNALLRIPGPTSPRAYLILAILMTCVGISAYVFFAADPWYIAIYRDIVGGRTIEAARWTVGRTGNYNYSWGAYVAQLIQIGDLGGIVACLYAIVFARSIGGRVLGWSIWLFWFLHNFGSGTRGATLFMGLPAAGLLLLKYQSVAAVLMRRMGFRAYVVCGGFMFVLLFLVQFQAQYRDTGYGVTTNFSDVDLTASRGNTMFSEGLRGYQLIPTQVGFFCDTFPGEAIVRPLPDTLFWFLIGPIPRALWNEKPADPATVWYTRTYLGYGDGMEGVSISKGAVGGWYFKYGIVGVLEGGVLVGWLMGLTERILRKAEGRAVPLILSLGTATWLFRSYRDLWFQDLYPVLFGVLLLAIFSQFVKPFEQQAEFPDVMTA